MCQFSAYLSAFTLSSIVMLAACNSSSSSSPLDNNPKDNEDGSSNSGQTNNIPGDGDGYDYIFTGSDFHKDCGSGATIKTELNGRSEALGIFSLGNDLSIVKEHRQYDNGLLSVQSDTGNIGRLSNLNGYLLYTVFIGLPKGREYPGHHQQDDFSIRCDCTQKSVNITTSPSTDLLHVVHKSSNLPVIYDWIKKEYQLCEGDVLYLSSSSYDTNTKILDTKFYADDVVVTQQSSLHVPLVSSTPAASIDISAASGTYADVWVGSTGGSYQSLNTVSSQSVNIYQAGVAGDDMVTISAKKAIPKLGEGRFDYFEHLLLTDKPTGTVVSFMDISDITIHKDHDERLIDISYTATQQPNLAVFSLIYKNDEGSNVDVKFVFEPEINGQIRLPYPKLPSALAVSSAEPLSATLTLYQLSAFNNATEAMRNYYSFGLSYMNEETGQVFPQSRQFLTYSQTF